jgi:hypothetical protein
MYYRTAAVLAPASEPRVFPSLLLSFFPFPACCASSGSLAERGRIQYGCVGGRLAAILARSGPHKYWEDGIQAFLGMRQWVEGGTGRNVEEGKGLLSQGPSLSDYGPL